MCLSILYREKGQCPGGERTTAVLLWQRLGPLPSSVTVFSLALWREFGFHSGHRVKSCPYPVWLGGCCGSLEILSSGSPRVS